jgi:CspA family cold shock protein
MRTGTVKWFHGTRGFGFIRPNDESTDVFVHMDTVRKAGMLVLTEGQKVRFDIGEHNGKRAAVNLQESR